MKTYTPKSGEITREWHVVDADGMIIGRMATEVARLLRGKHKPIFTPHMDCGDHVIIVNADKVKLTGKKRANKTYYWHTGFPGGIKQRTAEQLLSGRFPTRVVEKAVQRMMPKESPLARKQLTKLHIYAGSDHPHEAQKPQVLDFAARNPKNKR